MDKIEALYKKGFNYKNNIIFFPIKHHSPVCSYHLKNVIEEYKPQVILIEGPYENNDLIQYICSEESKPPLALYYTFKGKEKKEEIKCSCYYPFLEYSPEYVALKEAIKINAESKFIDLSYSQQHTCINKKSKILIEENEFRYSDYIDELCKKELCRDFDELWERLFEVNGLYKDTKEFIKDMYSFCYFSRKTSSRDKLIKDGTLIREKIMMDNINEEIKKNKRILVVTGGFHTISLVDYGEDIKYEEKVIGESKTYIMPYSMQNCSSLLGYASGVPYVNFYSKVHKNINNEGRYDNCTLQSIVSLGKNLRKKKMLISIPDEIEAYKMCKGLSVLRNKKEAGVYELIDGVKSTFIKGDEDYKGKKILDYLYEELIGKEIGTITKEANVPPIVIDFRNNLNKYRMKKESYGVQEKVLEIYKKPLHKEIYNFFNACIFLDLGFCKMIKGPDLLSRTNLNLIRAIYEYAWNTEVEVNLIEKSLYGSTINECCKNIIIDRLKETKDAYNYSYYIILCNNVGLEEEVIEFIPLMERIIEEDNNFIYLVKALYNLNYLKNLISYSYKKQIEYIDVFCKSIYMKLCALLKDIFNVKKDEEEEYIQGLLDLNHYALDLNNIEKDIFINALFEMLKENEINIALEGAIYGILYGTGSVTEDKVRKELKGSLEIYSFIKGLLYTAKDLLFKRNGILNIINEKLKTLTEKEFLIVLPELRYVFTRFSPREIYDLSEKIGDILNVNKEEVINEEGFMEEDIVLGEKLNKLAIEILRERGILLGE